MHVPAKLCKICGRPITDWQNKTDVHPDCELKANIQFMQRRTMHDGTGQDEEDYQLW